MNACARMMQENPTQGNDPRRKASTSGGSIGGSIAGSIPAPNARIEPFSCIRRKYRRKRSRGWFTFEKPPRQNIEKAVHVLYRVPISFDFLCRLTIIIQAFCINDIENTFSIFVGKNHSKPYKSTVFTEFILKIA